VSGDIAERRPLKPAPPFSRTGAVAVPDRWWTAFDDSDLDQQINHALAENYTLVAAWERIAAASALARREASDLSPDLNGIAGAEGNIRIPGEDNTLYALGLGASYEPDIWGRIQSRVEAERLRANAPQADDQSVALVLSGQIARTWLSLTEAHAQLELLDEQLESNATGLKSTELRWGLGQARLADVLRQRQLVESTREQMVVVQLRIDLLEHQLAVLQGQAPQEASFETAVTLPSLPPLPETGLTADLLRRRPDVRREFLALWAADRDLASAVTDQYPRVNLTASVTTAAEKPEDLFREWLGSIAGQLIAPLFDAGQRRAEVARTAAILDQRFAEYGQTVLNAFQEVEDALSRERYQAERIERLEEQLKNAVGAADALYEQLLIGDTDFLDWLSAVTTKQRLQRQTLSARLDLVLSRIDLYVALAGGFETM